MGQFPHKIPPPFGFVAPPYKFWKPISLLSKSHKYNNYDKAAYIDSSDP